VALTFSVALNGAGVRSALAVLIHPLEAEFGWSRAAIASAAAVTLVMLGVAAPLSGWLLDRFGPRRVILGALGLLIIGVTGTSYVQEIWQLVLLWGVVVGLGAGGMASVLGASVAHRWFVARRGLTLGILNSASSTGQLIFLPIMMALVVMAGWRSGLMIYVVVSFSLMLLIWFWMRDDPSDVGLKPYGSEEQATGDGEGQTLEQSGKGSVASRADLRDTDIFLSDAVKTSNFWLLCGSFFVCGGTANGLVGTHLIPHAIDQGIPEVTAAATVGVMGAMNFVGTMMSGYLTDKVDPRKLLSSVFVLRGVALFILPYVESFVGLFIFAVIYGLDWFATVPPTITLAGKAFGKHAIGRIYGWIYLSHQIGGALSAIGAGAIVTLYGEYYWAFFIGGVMTFAAAAMGLMVQPERPVVPPAPATEMATA
jgi:sugar phosphate permease